MRQLMFEAPKPVSQFGPVVMRRFFLFTDIQRSTRLWAEHTEQMASALGDHDAQVDRCVRQQGGEILASAGDGVQAVFDEPAAAVMAALEIQRWLAATEWDGIGRLRVRMGVHCGAPIRLVTGDYSGPVFNETARLHDAGNGGQVLVSADMADALSGVLPPGCRLESLGVHRLPDLEPAEVFQLCHPDLDSDFPPLRKAVSSTVQLVGGPSSFHGRENDVLRLNELVDVRLLTITGPGGVGKTRLAQVAADSRRPRHQDGVFVVDLGSVSRDAEVAPAVATSLRIELSGSGGGEETVSDRLVRWLQTKNILLLLDNCEHVAGAVAKIVSDVLATSSDAQFLCTSQHALNVDGEHIFELGPLAPPVGPGQEGDSAAVMLFIDRAREVRPNYRPGEAEIAEIAELCTALDGLPLAIEVAAARLGGESVSELLAGIEDVIGESEPDDVLGGRHGSLHQLVAWSYELLTDEEKVLFGRLWVFPGPFSLDAAQAVCGRDGELVGPRFRRVLASLVSKSVVMLDPELVTFRLLAPMRGFAHSTLSETEREVGRRRFVDWYASWVGLCERQLRGPDEREIGRRIESEFANIRSAHRRALELGRAEHAARIVAGMRVFAVHQFRFEVVAWAEVSLADRRTPEEWRPTLHGLCGVRAWMRGDLRAAASHADAAVEIEERLAIPTSIYARLVRLAVAGYEGRFDDALVEFTHAHEMAKRLADPWWEVEVLVFSAVGVAAQGDYDMAAAIAKSAAKLAKNDVGPTAKAWSLYALAESVYREDPALAADFLTSAAELAKTVHNEWILGLVNVSLARQRRRLGDHEKAAVLLIDDLDRWSRAGNWSEQWRTVREAAMLCATIGRDEDATALLGAVDGAEAVVPMSPQEQIALEDLRSELEARLGAAAVGGLERRGRLLADVTPEAVIEQARQSVGVVLA